MAIRYSDDSSGAADTEELLSGVSQWLRGLYEQVVGSASEAEGNDSTGSEGDGAGNDANAGDSGSAEGEGASDGEAASP